MIELLVVIAVIGGLAALFISYSPASQRRARDTIRRNDIKQYQTELEVYANKNNGFYPSASNTLNWVCGSYLSSPTCPDDPTGLYHYQYRGNGSEYVIWAQMEQKDNSANTVYFVTCSTGSSGDLSSLPGGLPCPL